jgi:hypothetical protein
MSKALENQLNQYTPTQKELEALKQTVAKANILTERLAHIAKSEERNVKPPLREELANIWTVTYLGYLQNSYAFRPLPGSLITDESIAYAYQAAINQADIAVEQYIKVRSHFENPIDKALEKYDKLLALAKLGTTSEEKPQTTDK